jgi:thiol-disulfide isomerase/thioredoxin
VADQPFIQKYRLQLFAGLVAVAVIAFVVIAALQAGGGSSGPATVATAADPALVQSVTGLPQSTFDTVGTGGVSNPLHAISAPALTSDGKPEVLYIGAEYCPYCAAERWAMLVALSKFGTFDGLKTTASASDDVYPNTPTFSFYGSTFASQYLTFTPVETFNNVRSGSRYGALQTPTGDQQTIQGQYDPGGIPFLDVGGKYVLSGASYSPDVFSGMDWQAIATALADPTSKQAKAVLGVANMMTAAFCQLTNGQPGAVCSAAGTKAGDSALGIAGN